MSKRPLDIPLTTLAIDRESSVPLFVQLYRGLRGAIASRRLAPGVRLPSTRALAVELGISRNTALAVYDQLHAEGYVEGHVGAGTYVVSIDPDPPVAEPTRAGTIEERATPRAETLSRFGTAIQDLGLTGPTTTAPVAFPLGVPDVAHFPADTWRRLMARRWRTGTATLLQGGSPSGYRPLREAIATYLGATRSVRCEADQIIIVSGTQRGLSLMTRVLLEPGDRVWMEDPGYPGAQRAFRAAGLHLEPVPIDGEGLSVAAGILRAPDARAAYITPSNQFPMNVTMSASRRLALLEWAHRNHAWIMEDDYDSEFRYTGRPLTALQGLDERDRVIYLGTYSKILFPSLRLGYIVAPPGLVDVFGAAQAVESGFPPTLDQAVLADFLYEGHFARHVRRMRSVYAERQDALLNAARTQLGDVLRVQPSPAGIHLVGRLAGNLDDRQLTNAALHHGVRVPCLSPFFLDPAGREQALLFGYAAPTPQEIHKGVVRLAQAFQDVA